MKYIFFFGLILISTSIHAQTFTRSELPTSLTTPWEITYGPDNYLWLTEANGKVVRVNPNTGSKQVVYTAPDYFNGDSTEVNPLCTYLGIGKGTLGLALHPDFQDSAKAYIFFVYSYNNGTAQAPETKFRIKRLKWDAINETIISNTNIVNEITTGYDHWGGRLLAVKQNNIPYIFYSLGDLGRSEVNSPTCYANQADNPNNFTQDLNSLNGKIHRFNIDGTIPTDNPVTGNSYYTRGHRNPQGLIYNSSLGIIYDVEHGDRTDDEINVLHKGMNYGWKDIRGYRDDSSYAGEAAYAANYTPNPNVPNDSLVDPFWSWCTTPSTSNTWTDWCTVAPSGGDYYGSNTISQWTNSLLVVTLKDGVTTDREVYQFKLQPNGDLVPSTVNNPNPKRFFGEDQAMNGRLRDIAISNDGMQLFLINNGGVSSDKITVYTYDTTTSIHSIPSLKHDLEIFPNPSNDLITIKNLDKLSNIQMVQIYSILGTSFDSLLDQNNQIDVSHLEAGVYFILISDEKKKYTLKFMKN